MPRIRVAACQIDTVVGDLEGNVTRVLDAMFAVTEQGVDVCVFPELTVTGYPPEDLLDRPAFVDDNLDAFERIAAASGPCAVVVGYVDRNPEGLLVNAAALCRDGLVERRYAKALLPNYGVFDEQRWFTAGTEVPDPVWVAGVPVGITICEDMWASDGPLVAQANAGSRLVVNLNASPYSRGRRSERLEVLRDRVAESGCALVYVNQVGGQDELVFDGASLVLDATGSVVASARQFREELLVADLDIDVAGLSCKDATPATSRAVALESQTPTAPVLGDVEEVYEALVLGTRDYLAKNGFHDAVIGLSGGIDSSLVAAIAVDALGPEHVHGVMMPSRYSSPGSLSDAQALADRLGIECAAAGIEPMHSAFADALSALIGTEPAGLTDENLQSRLRGVLLMALSNHHGWIVLTTGNKSEMATGYSTLYGDSAGGFAVIKDVPKLLVYDLCRFRNERAGMEVIPESVLVKPPSAELRPDQRDDESLPPYEVLDLVVAGYVEGDRSPAELVADGIDPAAVARVVSLVDRAEYKRRQMPPGVRISQKAFGKDRRMPITNHYRPTYE